VGNHGEKKFESKDHFIEIDIKADSKMKETLRTRGTSHN
jgi:hypothetical protein